MSRASHTTVSILQTLAITTPALYTALTFAYSYVVMLPMIIHAPLKLLEKQWLHAYQTAPVFIAPLVLLGAPSNALLAYLTIASNSCAPLLYMVASVATASIIPYTALYMEPGINGAGKWKVQELL
ncbi:hypothetical protein GQ44DRAFT_771376 [Phaeosphaeriaceae sp. PMI808]|nr:hypothetical protein GQ44DRAFT_771376 [Phaeosphaeriaceae sp. PMI808]